MMPFVFKRFKTGVQFKKAFRIQKRKHLLVMALSETVKLMMLGYDLNIFFKRVSRTRFLRNTGGMNLIEAALALSIFGGLLALSIITYSDVQLGQRPTALIAVGSVILSLVVLSVLWYHHKIFVLYLARKTDGEFDEKYSSFLLGAKAVLSKDVTVEEWSEPKIKIHLSFRWLGFYKIKSKNSSVCCNYKHRYLNEINSSELSMLLNKLSLETFGRFNHWLVRYWLSVEDLTLASKSLSMHQIMDLNAHRLNLLNSDLSKETLSKT